MALLGAALLFLGGSAVYATAKSYEYDTKGSVIIDGSARPKATNRQVTNGLLGWVSDGTEAITAANPKQHKQNMLRRTANLGVNPFNNLRAPVVGRPYKSPGVELDGPYAYAPEDARNAGNKEASVTQFQSPSGYLDDKRPEILEMPVRVGRTNVPAPMAGYLKQRIAGQNAPGMTTTVSFDARAQQYHNTSTTTPPTRWTNENIQDSDYSPSSSNFWETFPGPKRTVSISRTNIVTPPTNNVRFARARGGHAINPGLSVSHVYY